MYCYAKRTIEIRNVSFHTKLRGRKINAFQYTGQFMDVSFCFTLLLKIIN